MPRRARSSAGFAAWETVLTEQSEQVRSPSFRGHSGPLAASAYLLLIPQAKIAGLVADEMNRHDGAYGQQAKIHHATNNAQQATYEQRTANTASVHSVY
jgi:hypothetical protein